MENTQQAQQYNAEQHTIEHLRNVDSQINQQKAVIFDATEQLKVLYASRDALIAEGKAKIAQQQSAAQAAEQVDPNAATE